MSDPAGNPGRRRVDGVALYVGAAARVALVVLAVALVATVIVEGFRSDDLAVDLGDAFVPAAAAVWDGRSPYPDVDDAVVRAGVAYVYPPLTAVVLAPVSQLPDDVVRFGGTLLLLLAVIGTLAALGVRDWRCYCMALLWPSVLAAVQTANLTLVLGLGAALAWRYRDRPFASGAATGLTLALKPLLWPLLVWQVATRRSPAAIWSVVWSIALVLAASAVVGLSWLHDYPSLVRELGRLESPESYTVYALGLDVGLGSELARALALGLVAVALGAVVVLARRGDDRRAFSAAIVTAIVASPIVWLHYFALLLVPVALCSPVLSAVWFVPLVLWLGTGQQNGSPWQNAVVVAGAAATVALALRRPAKGGVTSDVNPRRAGRRRRDPDGTPR